MTDPDRVPPTAPYHENSLTNNPQLWHNSSLLSVHQIHPSGLTLLHTRTLHMRHLVQTHHGSNLLHHRILSSVFYEPSTRTSCSFQCAMLRLGGRFVHIDAAPPSKTKTGTGGGGGNSSTQKGESLADTIRSLQCYTDVTVLRHFTKGSVAQVVQTLGSAGKPIINGGDGTGEHPTQALLDWFTIKDELTNNGFFSKSNKNKEKKGGLKVVMLGDLKHGRTVHSLAKLLARGAETLLGGDGHNHNDKDKDNKATLTLRYCSPPSLQMPQEVKTYISQHQNTNTSISIIQQDCTDLTQAILDADVLYVTRLQKERFASLEEYTTLQGAYVVDAKLMESAPKHLVLMHPLPRVDEIDTNVDGDERAAYFRQMENGMFVRMAILSLLLGAEVEEDGGEGGGEKEG